MYELFLQKWLQGKISADKIDLLVKTGWLTEEDAEKIKATAKNL